MHDRQADLSGKFVEGDVITHINGTNIKGLEMKEIAVLIRQSSKSSLEFSVQRQNTDDDDNVMTTCSLNWLSYNLYCFIF